MKYLIITLLLFTQTSLACDNWISVSELTRSQEGEPAKAGCKKGEKCFCYEGVNLKDASVGMKEVDDKTKPIYEDDPELGRTLVGYEKKLVEGLVVDPDKKAARLVKEAQKEQERRAKEQYNQRRREAMEVIADEIGRDDTGKFLPKEEIRQNAKKLKSVLKQAK